MLCVSAALIALLEGGNDYLPELRGVAVGDLWRQFAQLRSVWGGDGKLPMLLAISGEKGCRFCMGRMVELLSEGMGAWDENEVLWAPGGGVMFDVERYLEVSTAPNIPLNWYLLCMQSQVLRNKKIAGRA